MRTSRTPICDPAKFYQPVNSDKQLFHPLQRRLRIACYSFDQAISPSGNTWNSILPLRLWDPQQDHYPAKHIARFAVDSHVEFVTRGSMLVEFASSYLSYFINGMILAAPLIGIMALTIIVLGLIASALESWRPFDAIYWAFITATTVGYGDIRPTKPSSRLLSILIALQGMIFTGIIVALAINAATITFSELHEGVSMETVIKEMDGPSSKQLLE